jgi:hypothetical protein
MTREIVTSENREEYINKKMGHKESKKDIYKHLKEENNSTYPKIPVQNVFHHPQGKLPESVSKSYESAMENEKSLPYEDIDTRKIIPTQRNVNAENLKHVKNVKDAKESILAVEHEGKYYLMDGHHRVANHILNDGTTIKARIHR